MSDERPTFEETMDIAISNEIVRNFFEYTEAEWDALNADEQCRASIIYKLLQNDEKRQGLLNALRGSGATKTQEKQGGKKRRRRKSRRKTKIKKKKTRKSRRGHRGKSLKKKRKKRGGMLRRRQRRTYTAEEQEKIRDAFPRGITSSVAEVAGSYNRNPEKRVIRSQKEPGVQKAEKSE